MAQTCILTNNSALVNAIRLAFQIQIVLNSGRLGKCKIAHGFRSFW
jgi:hypothetical protein